MNFARLEQKLIDGVVAKSRLAVKGVIRRGVLVPPMCAAGTFDIRDIRPFVYDVLSHLALVHDEVFEQLGEMQLLTDSRQSNGTGTFVAHVVGAIFVAARHPRVPAQRWHAAQAVVQRPPKIQHHQHHGQNGARHLVVALAPSRRTLSTQ